jgi:hypothetical protein
MLTTMPNGTKCVKVIDFGLADVMKDEFTDFPGSAVRFLLLCVCFFFFLN